MRRICLVYWHCLNQAYTYEARVILYLSFFSKKTQLLSSIINDLSKVLQMTLSLVGDFLAIENLFDLRSVGWSICNENIILFLPTSSIVLILRKVWFFFKSFVQQSFSPLKASQLCGGALAQNQLWVWKQRKLILSSPWTSLTGFWNLKKKGNAQCALEYENKVKFVTAKMVKLTLINFSNKIGPEEK